MKESIDALKYENAELKKQVDMLMNRMSSLELQYANSPASAPSVPSMAPSSPGAAASGTGATPGRKTIPFDKRSTKQHQNRMDYLLRKIKNADKETWTYDAIADVQTYSVATNIPSAGNEFFKKAVIECAGDNGLDTITDIDVLMAILQSYNT